MTHRLDPKDAPWRKVTVAKYDYEETLECGHDWYKRFHDKITKHAKKRRCVACLREGKT
jgi:hypothetical protein